MVPRLFVGPSALRSRIAAGLGVIGIAVGLVAVFPGYVEASFLQSDDAIENLTVCYALGTDMIGRGDLQGGKTKYKECFTDNAVLSVYLPGQNPNGVPFFSTVGTDSWANFVEDTFVSSGYVATQHLMGTINVEVQSITNAKMTSYLNATHVRADKTINIANGTYTDAVVLDHGLWKIKKRTLVLISLVDAGVPAP